MKKPQLIIRIRIRMESLVTAVGLAGRLGLRLGVAGACLHEVIVLSVVAQVLIFKRLFVTLCIGDSGGSTGSRCSMPTGKGGLSGVLDSLLYIGRSCVLC